MPYGLLNHNPKARKSAKSEIMTGKNVIKASRVFHGAAEYFGGARGSGGLCSALGRSESAVALAGFAADCGA